MKKVRAFCPTCGELEIKNGEILHPQMDYILSQIFKNSCTINYTRLLRKKLKKGRKK